MTRTIGPPDVEVAPARLLDTRAAAALLRSRIELPKGFDWASVRIGRVYPTKTQEAGIQFDVALAGPRGQITQGTVYLTSGLRGRRSTKLRLSPATPFRLSGLLCRARTDGFALHTPDRDDALPALRSVGDGEAWSRRLSDLAQRRCQYSAASWRVGLGNYRPRRRCTLLFHGRGPDPAPGDLLIVGKVFRRGFAFRRARVARAIGAALRPRTDASLCIPRVLGVWRDHSLVLFEGLRPATCDMPPALLASRHAEAAGRALGGFHECGVDKLPVFTPADELAATGRWVGLAAQLGRTSGSIQRIWHWLCAAAEKMNGCGTAVIHRDFHASQLLETAEGWGLVDLDTAARGDPEQDLGNYLGHLIWAAQQLSAEHASWQQAGRSFLNSYERSNRRASRVRQLRSIDAVRLHFYLISSLLRVGIIHNLRSTGGKFAIRLHQLAEAWLENPNPVRSLFPPRTTGRHTSRSRKVRPIAATRPRLPARDVSTFGGCK